MYNMTNESPKCYMQRGFKHGVSASAALDAVQVTNLTQINISIYFVDGYEKENQKIFCLLAWHMTAFV